LKHKLLIKILYNRSSKEGPYGTPDSMGNVEEDFPKVRTTEKENNNDNNNKSILYYLCAKSIATRPITDTAQCKYK
jgi:hypothetical protein